MYEEFYDLGVAGLIALFGSLTAACLIFAPYIGQRLRWTAPSKDRADYVVRAQATIITVTGMVLAFCLVQVQGNLRQTEELVAREASSINALDRLLMRYSDQGAALRPLLTAYTNSVIHDEWPALREGRSSAATGASFTLLSRGLFRLDPQSNRQVTIYGEMIKSIDEMADERERRLGSANLHLHGEFWLVTILLGLILVALSVSIEADGYHIASIAAQGLALALLAALVFYSDHPFKGSIAVSPAPLVRVLGIMAART